jgi:hypothetical protein
MILLLHISDTIVAILKGGAIQGKDVSRNISVYKPMYRRKIIILILNM